MEKYFDSSQAAMVAATRYRLQHGGSIVGGGAATEKDQDDRVVGTYQFIAVVRNPTKDNPLGKDWKEFPFDYHPVSDEALKGKAESDSPLFGIWSREYTGQWTLLYQYPRSRNRGQVEATLRKAQRNSPNAKLKIDIVPE